MTRGDWVAVGCLGTIAIPALDQPVVLVLFWPATLIVGLIAIVATLRGLRLALDRRLPLERPSELRIALVAVIIACLVGAIASLVPVLAVQRTGHGFVPYELSRSAAPAVWAGLLIVAARALRVPSPRRITWVIAAVSAAWPALLALRAMREPFMDLDGRFLILAPWALQAFAACAVATAAIAIFLAHATRRACASPEPVLPPRAQVIDT